MAIDPQYQQSDSLRWLLIRYNTEFGAVKSLFSCLALSHLDFCTVHAHTRLVVCRGFHSETKSQKGSWIHFDIIGYTVQEMKIGIQVKFCVKICPSRWIWLKQSTFCEYQSDNLMLAKQTFLRGSSLPLYTNVLPVESNTLMTHNGATPPRSSNISPYSGTKWKAYEWKNQAKRQITRVLAMTFKMLHTLSKYPRLIQG